MIYLIKYKKINKKRGFNIIEILVVLGIFGILFSVSTSSYANLRAQNNLSMSVSSVVESIRYAKSKAQAVSLDLNWGVKILENEIVIFSGLDYANRNNINDEIFSLPNGLSVSGLDEIIFEKVTGQTNNIGTITLTNSAGTKDINLNSYGTVNY